MRRRQQIRRMFEKTVDLDLNFGEVTLGWKLAQQLLKHACDVIENNFGYFFGLFVAKMSHGKEKEKSRVRFPQSKEGIEKTKEYWN